MLKHILPGMLLLMISLPVTSFGAALSLSDCIDLGLQNNQTLRVNRFETQRSISQAKSNIGMVLPSVNYALTGSGSEVANLGWNNRYSHSLSVTQNIWDGGRWWNTLKSARLAEDVADIQYTNYELSTAYQVKLAFYNYLSTRRLLDVYQENLKTSLYQHQLTLERFHLGAASQNDTLRTRVTIEQNRLQIINGQTSLQDKARALNVILGRDPETVLELADPVWEAVKVPQLEEAYAELLSGNPQLQLLDRNREMAHYSVKIARAGYIPSLGLNASYSNGGPEIGDVFGDNTATLTAGMSLSWNLFNGTRTKRSVEQSRISEKISQENLDLTRRNMKKELAQTLEQMQALNESVRISKLIVEATEQDLLLAQEQYRIGSISILDVLQITARLEDSKSGLIRAQYNLKIAEAGLLQLLGKY